MVLKLLSECPDQTFSEVKELVRNRLLFVFEQIHSAKDSFDLLARQSHATSLERDVTDAVSTTSV